jgi:hypothetical protein
MMRPTSIGCTTCALALLLAVGSPALAQDKAQTKPAKPAPAPKVITLSGCVVRNETPPGQYTIEDKQAGVTYRLTGTDVRDYLGRRVQVVGATPSRRFTIVGGLTPNANVAAQAGDMDPARAAMAGAGGSAGPGTVQLPEFKVKSVRPVNGNCPD